MGGARRWGIAAVVSSGMLGPATAQMAMPQPATQDGAKLFKNQCATCHTLSASDPKRQGPTLDAVYGRHAGSAAAYTYSAGFVKADWVWDEAHLDAWLMNPQAVIPGATMAYRQAKPEIRKAIIEYLKEAH